MQPTNQHIIYTIGHSTHSFDEFLSMLNAYEIKVLADIRSLPGSRKFPQFDKEDLEKTLPENGIAYIHLLGLGGRRKVNKNSRNTRWKNDSFRSYADYMETDLFKNAIEELEAIALQKTTAYMCAEAVYWRCHRSMVSDYLKNKGWDVIHIFSEMKTEEHRYTSPARIVNDKVCYFNDELF